MKNTKGITLVALVITIIVLLIFAAISITTLRGDNSIINRAENAKIEHELSSIQEILNKAYVYLLGKARLGSEVSMSDIVEWAKRNGCQDKIVGMAGQGYKLSKTEIFLSTTSPTNEDFVTIEKDSDSDDGSAYYAIAIGRYFRIYQDGNDIIIERTPINVSSNNEEGVAELNLNNSDVTIGNGNDTGLVTFNISDNNKINITSVGTTGETTLNVSVNGRILTGNIKVVPEIIVPPIDLSGSLQLLSTTSGKNTDIKNIEMTTSDPDIVTVTDEGIVKCSKKTGTAIVTAKKGTDTYYYKVTSDSTIVSEISNENKTIDGQPASADNPTIPAGFCAVNTKTGKWKDENGNVIVSTPTSNGYGAPTNVKLGLVIMDSRGNQFVWVPIKVITESGELQHVSTLCGTVSIAKLRSGSTTNYWGVVHQWPMSGSSVGYFSESERREPITLNDIDGESYTNSNNETKTYLSIISDLLYDTERYGNKYYDSSTSKDKYKNITEFGKTLQEDYNAAINSIKTYGGFYIGRCESSFKIV